MRCYFIGIGGIGMSALAYQLLDMGQKVAGSDLRQNPITQDLEKLGANIIYSQEGKAIEKGDRCIFSTAVKNTNKDLIRAKELGCELLHRSDLLAELTSGKQFLAVAGSHGKTTTSSLLSHSLIESGRDPSFILGGVLHESRRNGRFGHGSWGVFEADESDGTHERYSPERAIITNIDAEHLDLYKDIDGVKESFERFANQVKNPAQSYFCADDPLLFQMELPWKSYGFSETSDWIIKDYFSTSSGIQFDLEGNSGIFRKIKLPLLGRHNAQNSAGAFLSLIDLGIPEEQIIHGFSKFSGVGKRMEKSFEHGSVVGYHDYAHHPTEIFATLSGLREAFSNKKILAIVQPHRFSRTKQSLGSFREGFEFASKVVVTDIFSAGEDDLGTVSGVDVATESNNAEYISKDDLLAKIMQIYEGFDLIVTMGAGDIYQIFKQLNREVKGSA